MRFLDDKQLLAACDCSVALKKNKQKFATFAHHSDWRTVKIDGITEVPPFYIYFCVDDLNRYQWKVVLVLHRIVCEARASSAREINPERHRTFHKTNAKVKIENDSF